jgi:hypothetical protein
MKNILNKFGYVSRRVVIGMGVGLGVATAVAGIFALTQIGEEVPNVERALAQYNKGGTSGGVMTPEELSAQLARSEANRAKQNAIEGKIPRGELAGGEVGVKEGVGVGSGVSGFEEGSYAKGGGGIEGMRGEEGLRGVESEVLIEGGVRNQVQKNEFNPSQTKGGVSGGGGGAGAGGGGTSEVMGRPKELGGEEKEGGSAVGGVKGESSNAYGRGRAGALGGTSVGGSGDKGLGSGQAGAGGLAGLVRASRMSQKAAAVGDISKKGAAAVEAFAGGGDEGVSVNAEGPVGGTGGMPAAPNVNTNAITGGTICTGDACKSEEVKKLEKSLYGDMDNLIKKGRGVGFSWNTRKQFEKYFDVNGDSAGAKLKSIEDAVKNRAISQSQYEMAKFLFYREFLYVKRRFNDTPGEKIRKDIGSQVDISYRDIVGYNIKQCKLDDDDKDCTDNDKTIAKWYSEQIKNSNSTKINNIRKNEQALLCAIFQTIAKGGNKGENLTKKRDDVEKFVKLWEEFEKLNPAYKHYEEDCKKKYGENTPVTTCYEEGCKKKYGENTTVDQCKEKENEKSETTKIAPAGYFKFDRKKCARVHQERKEKE